MSLYRETERERWGGGGGSGGGGGGGDVGKMIVIEY